jgi:hypothetical protein
LSGTLQAVYQKSFKNGGRQTTFEIEQGEKPIPHLPMAEEKVDELRAMSKSDIMDKLRLDVARIVQTPPNSTDNDSTVLVTILNSLSISQFKGRLEAAYAVTISDEYLFGETVTLKKLAEVVKLGYAPDDTGGEGPSTNSGNMSSAAGMPQSTAHGLGVRVCCAIQ